MHSLRSLFLHGRQQVAVRAEGHGDTAVAEHFLYVAAVPLSGTLVGAMLALLAARTLDGKPVTFTQDAHELAVSVAEADRDTPVTVIELTLDRPFEPGTLVGGARQASRGMA